MLIFVQNLSNFTCLTTEFHNYDHTKGELTKGDLFYFGMAGGSGHNTILKTYVPTQYLFAIKVYGNVSCQLYQT